MGRLLLCWPWSAVSRLSSGPVKTEEEKMTKLSSAYTSRGVGERGEKSFMAIRSIVFGAQKVSSCRVKKCRG